MIKKETLEVQNALYVGMDLYKQLRNTKFVIGDYEFKPIDNICYCLYLGILCTDNEISKELKEVYKFPIQQYNIKKWNDKQYVELYKECFSQILDNQNFENINDYCAFLLKNEGVIKYIEYDVKKYDYQKVITKKLQA